MNSSELCECGHAMTAHIYHEGACRPGFVCEGECEEFRPVASKHQPNNTIDLAALGDYVDAEVRATGLCSEALERVLGIPQHTISNLSTRKSDPDYYILRALCDWLDVPVSLFHLDADVHTLQHRAQRMDTLRRRICKRAKSAARDDAYVEHMRAENSERRAEEST